MRFLGELHQIAKDIGNAIFMLAVVLFMTGVTVLVCFSLLPTDNNFVVMNIFLITTVAWFGVFFADAEYRWHHLQIVAIFCSLLVGYLSTKTTPSTLARISDTSYFEVVAQVIPVLMLARVIELGIRVRQLSGLDINRVVEVVSIAILAGGELAALYSISDGFTNSTRLGMVNSALVYGFTLVAFAGFREVPESIGEDGPNSGEPSARDESQQHEPHGYL
jgi:hypothetical protein